MHKLLTILIITIYTLLLNGCNGSQYGLPGELIEDMGNNIEQKRIDEITIPKNGIGVFKIRAGSLKMSTLRKYRNAFEKIVLNRSKYISYPYTYTMEYQDGRKIKYTINPSYSVANKEYLFNLDKYADRIDYNYINDSKANALVLEFSTNLKVNIDMVINDTINFRIASKYPISKSIFKIQTKYKNEKSIRMIYSAYIINGQVMTKREKTIKLNGKDSIKLTQLIVLASGTKGDGWENFLDKKEYTAKMIKNRLYMVLSKRGIELDDKKEIKPTDIYYKVK